ncbi:MAG: alanyl-tRNA synthetase, partial [Solirubrobacteraceae bacterium]|nr:alanyl-tRNA synthetase [Solirubrobacteraceae bacterium]
SPRAGNRSSPSRRSPSLRPLPQHNVDVGLGLERITCVLQGIDSVYETDLFSGLRSAVRELASTVNERAERIVCDHVRSSVLHVRDGVLPSNKAILASGLRSLLRSLASQAERGRPEHARAQ